MDAEQDTAVASGQSNVPRPPRIHIDSRRLPTDSMVTVPLSETDGAPMAEDDPASQQPATTVDEEKGDSSRTNSAEIRKAFGQREDKQEEDTSPTISLSDADSPEASPTMERSRSNSNGSDQSSHVDWAELEKKEEQEPQEKDQNEVR